MTPIETRQVAHGRGIIIIAAALAMFGVVMLASTGASIDHPFSAHLQPQSHFARQAAAAIAACLIMPIVARVGPGLLRWRAGAWCQLSVVMFVVCVGLLAAVWTPHFGVESHGRRRWIDLGPFVFQPSEFAKLTVIVFMAALLARSKQCRPDRPPGLVVPLLGLGVICALVGVEDYGTAVLLAVVGGFILIAAGCRAKQLALCALPGVAALVVLLFLQTYRLQRVTGFLHVWDDPQGRGYHPLQSLTAIASGGWTGRGLGAGLAKFDYLPEVRTDFVFSVICEETGFLGGMLVILLYVALMGLGLRMFLSLSSDRDGGFAKLFAFGATLMLGMQAMMNIAVVTVVAPTKGIALPLVSAGCSGLICFAVLLGLLAGSGRRRTTATRAVSTHSVAQVERVSMNEATAL